MGTKDWPDYQCHKVVQALPLVGISHAEDAPEAALRFEDGSDLIVSEDWLKKHSPQVGGYVVRYEDGYLSWSPKDVFESGYIPTSDPVSQYNRIIASLRMLGLPHGPDGITQSDYLDLVAQKAKSLAETFHCPVSEAMKIMTDSSGELAGILSGDYDADDGVCDPIIDKKPEDDAPNPDAAPSPYGDVHAPAAPAATES